MATALMVRYERVRGRVAAACARVGRSPESVTVLAVTKGVAAETVRAAAAHGMRRFAENYVQEWQAKCAALTDLADLEWHFIGRIQRNKASAVARATLVHSVADARVAGALDQAAARHGAVLRILLQVNVAGERSKAGMSAEMLPDVLAAVRALAWLQVVGLMTIPPALGPEAVRPYFRALRELRDRQLRAAELAELSMGMSDDFEAAIEEGATMIRLGTALFGPRTEAP